MANAAAAVVLYRIYELPLSTGRRQDHKFRKTAQIALGDDHDDCFVELRLGRRLG